MVWAWRQSLALDRLGSMLGGRKITATLTAETVEWSVDKCCLQGGILLPHKCEAWL